MKFRDLKEDDVEVIKGHYEDTSISKRDAQKALAKIFGVHSRTIRKWAKRMALNVRSGDIEVHGAEILTNPKKEKSPAKILVFDIETAPMQAFIWSMWNMNVGSNLAMLQSDWFILTWSAKWLFEDKVYSDKITPAEVAAEDDSRVVKTLWTMLNEADVVIGFNSLRFDHKKLNTRFLYHRLNPPMPYQVIDVMVHAKKKFAISSNKLDYVAKFLDMGSKVSTGGFDLWKRCMAGEQEALDKMEVYNQGDVTLLEDVYLVIRPYITPHPNMGLFIAEDVTCCPTCSSKELIWEGTYKTYANAYEAFRCGNCGAVGRSRTTSIPRRSKSNLTISVP